MEGKKQPIITFFFLSLNPKNIMYVCGKNRFEPSAAQWNEPILVHAASQVSSINPEEEQETKSRPVTAQEDDNCLSLQDV